MPQWLIVLLIFIACLFCAFLVLFMWCACHLSSIIDKEIDNVLTKKQIDEIKSKKENN